MYIKYRYQVSSLLFLIYVQEKMSHIINNRVVPKNIFGRNVRLQFKTRFKRIL